MRGGGVLIEERVAPSDAPPTVLGAQWSNWWGSPQLYAQLVKRITREAGDVATVGITFEDDGREERFGSGDEFLAQVSPEMLRSFTSATCSVRGFVCEADLVMRREVVSVEVRAADPQDAHVALARIVDEANRGYRPFWGPASWPCDVARKTRYQRLGGGIRDLLDVAVAVVFGLVAVLAVSRVAGVHELPFLADAFIVSVGGLVVHVINKAVPAVEIALQGKTRFTVLGTRLAVWLAPQVLALLGLAS